MAEELMTSMRTVAIIPTFNEGSLIQNVVDRTRNYVSAVVVADDGSTDGSTENLKDCVILRNEKNSGKGAALRASFDYAIKQEFDVVITLDGDGEHDPTDIPFLLRELENAYFVIGQREVQRNVVRSFLNDFSSFWMRQVVGNIRDTQCGFRAVKVSLLKKMNLTRNKFDLELEMLLEVQRLGEKIQQVRLKNSPIRKSHVSFIDYIRINNTFDEWFLNNYKNIKIKRVRKLFLLSAAIMGLGCGKVVLWMFEK